MVDTNSSGGDANKGEYKPEFEIVEEVEQAAGSQNQPVVQDPGKGQGGDERLGQQPGQVRAEGDEDQGQQQDLTARQRRRQRERMVRTAERVELERLRNENAQLREHQIRTDARISNVEGSTIDAHIASLEQEISNADAVMARAVTAQNGEDMVAAQRIRDTLRDRVSELKRLKAAQTEQTRTSTEKAEGRDARDIRLDGQSGAGFKPTPSQVQNARIFLQRHQWYKIQGGDDDSQAVTAIDSEMMAEGGNPSTAEYWVELERRIREELPHRFAAADNKNTQTVDSKQKTNGNSNGSTHASGPRLPGGGGSGGSGGPAKFHLSPARKQALVDAGVWDNPPERDRYIKRFIEWDKANPGTQQ